VNKKKLSRNNIEYNLENVITFIQLLNTNTKHLKLYDIPHKNSIKDIGGQSISHLYE